MTSADCGRWPASPAARRWPPSSTCSARSAYPTPSAIDVVGRLVDRSLISLDVTAGGQVRYRLLDSVREFSGERLRESGSAEVAQGAHAAWFGEAAIRAEQGVRGPEQSEHLAMARSERANIDEALAWTATHDPLLGLRIARRIRLGLGGHRRRRRRVPTGSARALAAADGRPRPGPGVRAAARRLARGVRPGTSTGRPADIEDGMAIADDELRGVGRLYLAFVRSQQGRAQDALTCWTRAGPCSAARGMEWEEAADWVLTAWAEIARGEMARGKAACDEALRLIVPIGDNWGRIHAEAMLGGLAQAEHRFADAAAHLEQAADAAHQLGFRAAEAHHLTNLGWAEHQLGDPQRATATLERAIDVGRATGDLRTAALAQVRLGRVRALARPVGRTPGRHVAAADELVTRSPAECDASALLADSVLAALDVEDARSCRPALLEPVDRTQTAATIGA